MTGVLGYWEERARRYSGEGWGLRAVCSYGMPPFYNGAIHLSQRLALDRWLRVEPGGEALDLGCGVGRWSRLLAQRGAQVTGVDLSPTMLREAARRAAREGVSERCRFVAGDLAELDLGRSFKLVCGVTVLQHVVEPARFEAAVARAAAHVTPGGRLVLLEAAPSHRPASRDTARLRVRSSEEYLAAFARRRLRLLALTGVDPLPLKIRYLPRYERLPQPLGVAGLAALTLLSLPVELLLGRRWVRSSWHKVFVLERQTEGGA